LQKVLYAQKSHSYDKQKRASAVKYAVKARQAENEIHQLTHHYNKELIIVWFSSSNGKTSGIENPVKLSFFNPLIPSVESVTGFVESNGYISIETEHYSRKANQGNASWNVIDEWEGPVIRLRYFQQIFPVLLLPMKFSVNLHRWSMIFTRLRW